MDKVLVNKNRVDYYFSLTGNLQKYFKKKNHLFFEYNQDLTGINESILNIPFVANIIPLAWITNSHIEVKELDSSFYQCLSKIKNSYQKMYPSVKFRGKLSVNTIINNTYTPERKSAQLFSGGLDALATFIRNKESNPILITEYGWDNNDRVETEVWKADKENAIKFAQDNGLENILVYSNYATFLNDNIINREFLRKLGDSWWHGLHHSLAIISAAIPPAVKLKVGCIFIASSFFKGFKAKCASDPSVDNEIRYASGIVVHDGYELNRQDKVKLMVDYYSGIKQEVLLKVCFLKEENCCNCEKCMRTVIGIVAEGRDPGKYGFNCSDNLSSQLKKFLEENVKYFNHSKIMQWNLAKNRMKENSQEVLYYDLLDWFLDYDFSKQRKKTLLKYRVTKFFPIIKRRLNHKLKEIILRAD